MATLDPDALVRSYSGTRAVGGPRAARRAYVPAGTCAYCGASFDPARTEELGYRHCTMRSCVAKWRQEQAQAEGLHLVLVPKVGFTWTRDDRDLRTGKSSGRS